MTPRFLHVPIFLTLVGLAGAADATPPKLAIVISVDQLRADYLVRFRPYFGEGGFKRLLEGGTEFRNAHFRHAITQTAPGHAQMLSGVFADVHGICAHLNRQGDLANHVARVGADHAAAQDLAVAVGLG